MAQEDKVKLKLLVEMVKILNQRVQYFSYFVGIDKETDKKLKKKIKDIEDQIE
ncbi:MAG: hypothetical protein IIC75_00410 [Bacteroidetes bacterium]|nr:hypothetical protein [Bacteroidota bacterium]